MKKLSSVFFSLFLAFSGFSQQLTGEELLANSIEYHDPSGVWRQFKGMLTVVMQRPNGAERITEVQMDFTRQFFNATSYENGDTVVKSVNKGACSLSFNGENMFDEATEKKYQLNCDNAVKMRDYYTYLYGLPMKLNDPGTLIDPVVKEKKFNGKKALVLKVNYTEAVGKDTWYFYFDPTTYALQAYQFFHDELKNDGEYILLSKEIVVNGIKMPKNRAWFFNKDGKHLGTDVLK